MSSQVQTNIDKFLSYQPVIKNNNIEIDLPAEMTVEYFASLRNMVEPYLKKSLTRNVSTKRANDRSLAIELLLPDKFKVETIVDIGCSNGEITNSLGERFRCKVYGFDVREDPNLVVKNFEFQKIEPNEKYPIEDNSVDLIISMAVLHHVEDIDFLLSEVRRMLKPGGYFIIREHDCDSQDLSDTLDIIHGLYACVLNEPQEETPEEFIANYYAHYRTRVEWAKHIAAHGFMRQYEIGYRKYDLQKLYFMAFRKTNNGSYDRLSACYNSIVPNKRLSKSDQIFLKKHGSFRKMIINDENFI